MVLAGYHNGTHNDTPHRPRLRRCAQDEDALRVRGIPDDLADEAGIYTEEGAMRIPHYDIAGDVWAVQRRPHNRRPDAPKYLFDAGTRMGIHIPPSEAAKLRDVEIPIILTESALKAAAIIGALRVAGMADRYAVISIPGVTTWRRDGGPIPDFEDFPARRKERDRLVYRRPLIIAFDSNAATNPNVIRARWQLTDYLRRVRKHEVHWIDVPEGSGETPKARERGIDDVMAEGIATITDMLASAYPAPDIMPALDTDTTADSETSELDRLRTENAGLRQLVRAQAELITNPMLKEKERAVGFRVITLANQRKSAGDVGPDGRPRLRASDIANDYRARPPKGEALPETNPDGSRPITRRQNVKAIVQTLTRAGVLSVGTEPTMRTAANGDTYADTDLVVEVEDTTAAIVKLAGYRAKKTRAPYTRQEPCPHCGEVHERTVIRQTFCGSESDPGCGGLIKESAPMVLTVPPASAPDATDDQRADLEEITATETGSPKNGEARRDGYISSSSPAPRNYSSPKNGEPPVTCAWPGGCSAPAGDGGRCAEHSLIAPAARPYTLEPAS